MTPQELYEAGRRIVANEVCYCVSGLIAAALNNFEASTQLGFDEDDLYRLATRAPDADDYSDAAPRELWIVEKPEGWDFRNDTGTGDEQGADFLPSAVEAWRAAFDAAMLDHPDGAEIYEHWLVSDWLAARLEEKGESIVRDAVGLTIWGRATTGQAIAIDGVIEEIARDLHAPCREA